MSMRKDKPVKDRITFGVISNGDIRRLLMCLTSMLIGNTLPKQVIILFNGESLDFAEFYLEQLTEIYRIRGMKVRFIIEPNLGVRPARQQLLSSCDTEYLWMGDNDCVYEYDCLSEFICALNQIDGPFGFIAGCKINVDSEKHSLNSIRVRPQSELKDGDDHGQLYERNPKIVRTWRLDTGNCFLDVRSCREGNATFAPFEDSVNAGGEDYIFGLMADKSGLESFFAPNAFAYHLGKPLGTSFTESAARRELLLRSCDILGLDKSRL